MGRAAQPSLGAQLAQAGFLLSRGELGEEIRWRRTDDDALVLATAKLETHSPSAKVERDTSERLQDVGAEEQGGFVRKAEHLERRHIGERDRDVAQDDRPELKLVDSRELHFDADSGYSDRLDF